MVANARKLGSSLQVPSVQELAKEKSARVLFRYVHPDQDPVILGSTNLLEVPVIDMEILVKCYSTEYPITTLVFLSSKLINHGVGDLLLDKVKTEVEEFFKLPLEDKLKFGQLEGDIEGFGQAFIVSNEQNLDWAEMFYIPFLRI